jgi:hypothetical protein
VDAGLWICYSENRRALYALVIRSASFRHSHRGLAWPTNATAVRILGNADDSVTSEGFRPEDCQVASLVKMSAQTSGQFVLEAR